MTAPRKTKRAKTATRRKAAVPGKTKRAKARPHQGLPAADSVRAVVKFVSPKKVRYTILKTSEKDAYDKA